MKVRKGNKGKNSERVKVRPFPKKSNLLEIETQ